MKSSMVVHLTLFSLHAMMKIDSGVSGLHQAMDIRCLAVAICVSEGFARNAFLGIFHNYDLQEDP